MAIPTKYAHRLIYHFTHIDNLPNLLKTGFLCNNHDDFPAGACLSIAEEGIQARRAAMNVTCGPGGKVHDYVPLYFGSKSPMLLGVVHKKNVDQMDILFFEFPISLLARADTVFTDASANTVTPPNFYSDPVDLEKLNWDEIDSLKWKSADDNLRHQRMAEVLVHSCLPIKEASRVVVWNDSVKTRVQKIVEGAGMPFPAIEFESPSRRHYFTKFTDTDAKGQSIVAGPRTIKTRYKNGCAEMGQKIGKQPNAKFETPRELLMALRANFGCLPHTAELIGLKSENGVHKQTVDKHTASVVEKLRALPEFKALSADRQDSLEIAAFLHDIGKGPKARWTANDGVQKVDPDHAVRAIPMVVEILTEHVGNVKQEEAELILKLVTYHDLAGEVLGKGRNEQQLIDVAGNKTELDMLFALGKADATSLVELWWDEKTAMALYGRCLAKIEQ